MVYKDILIDSSVWAALYTATDSNHKKALTYNELYVQEQIVPDLVFYEVLTVLKNNFKQKSISLSNFRGYMTESSQIVIHLFYEHNKEVLKLFDSDIAKGLSYVDTLLLYLSKKYYILTFDKKLQKAITDFGGMLVK